MSEDPDSSKAVQEKLRMSGEKIDYRFKLLYAIGMIIVVAGHCGGDGGFSLMYEFFTPYSFHLALFVFCSGYFYKDTSERTVGKYVLKKVKSLLIPLYLWNLFYGILQIFMFYKGFSIGESISLYNLTIAPIVSGHQFIYNMGGWFVIPLFMIQVYNVLMRKLLRLLKCSHSDEILVILTLALGIWGVFMASGGYNENIWLILVRMLYFAPFFQFGIFYKKYLEKFDHLPNLLYFIIVIGAQLFIIWKFGKQLRYTPSWCDNFVDGPIMPFVVGVLGIAFWLRMAKILEPALGRSKWVNLIADNTYTIMINQILGFMVAKTVFAVMNKYMGIFSGFDWGLYKADYGYIYLPGNHSQMKIIYMAFGIMVPILIQMIVRWSSAKIKSWAAVQRGLP